MALVVTVGGGCEPSRTAHAESEIVHSEFVPSSTLTYAVVLTAKGPPVNSSSGRLSVYVDDAAVLANAPATASLVCDAPVDLSDTHDFRTGLPPETLVSLSLLQQGPLRPPFEVQCEFALEALDSLSETAIIDWHVEGGIVWETRDEVELNVAVEQL